MRRPVFISPHDKRTAVVCLPPLAPSPDAADFKVSRPEKRRNPDLRVHRMDLCPPGAGGFGCVFTPPTKISSIPSHQSNQLRILLLLQIFLPFDIFDYR